MAARLFPEDRLPLVEEYAARLAADGVVRGLIGPREVPRLWDRHLLNCALLSDLIPRGATVADVGSGAGLPGVVLALARPDLTVTLVEPLLRRTVFLEEIRSDLGLDGLEVHRGRADSLHGVRTFDVVTSRAVAALPKLLAWSMPLVAPLGALVAMKGESVSDEIVEARSTLTAMGCAEPSVHVLGEGLLESTTTAVRVAWADPSRVDWRSAVPPEPRARQGGSQRRKGKQKRRR